MVAKLKEEKEKQASILKPINWNVPARARPTLIDKGLLKVVSKMEKKEAKIFTMSNIETDTIVLCDALKQLLEVRCGRIFYALTLT